MLIVEVVNIILHMYLGILHYQQEETKLLKTHLFVEKEHREFLWHLPSRWLSLQPYIEIILLS